MKRKVSNSRRASNKGYLNVRFVEFLDLLDAMARRERSEWEETVQVTSCRFARELAIMDQMADEARRRSGFAESRAARDRARRGEIDPSGPPHASGTTIAVRRAEPSRELVVPPEQPLFFARPERAAEAVRAPREHRRIFPPKPPRHRPRAA